MKGMTLENLWSEYSKASDISVETVGPAQYSEVKRAYVVGLQSMIKRIATSPGDNETFDQWEREFDTFWEGEGMAPTLEIRGKNSVKETRLLPTSELGNLSFLAKKVKKVITREYGHGTGFILIFSNPEKHHKNHYVANVDRPTTVKILGEMAEYLGGRRAVEP